MPFLIMMNRDLRRVPRDYEPPRDERGEPHPCFGEFYAVALARWQEGERQWNAGTHPDFTSDWANIAPGETSWADWHGEAPDPAYYWPGSGWPEGSELGIRMYETTTEGTPMSAWHPDTAEGRDAMARELAGADSGITSDLTVEEWRSVIDGQAGAIDTATGEVVAW